MATEIEHPMAFSHHTPPPAQSPSTSASGCTPVSSGHSTMSASTPLSHNMSGQSSASRRPPRKSTLTQQQKNQKRQRATQDQLNTLEIEFNKNPTPTAEVRDRIADEINMTERSVQIWFQNRRAKIKLMAKKHLETGEDIDSIPESMRAYLAMQAMESGKGLGAGWLGRTGLGPYYQGNMLFGGDQGVQGKVVITHLSCGSLNVGTWSRVGQNTMDLIIFYSPEKSTMTYYINNDQAGYKIEYPFSYIKSIQLENSDPDPNRGAILIELNAPPFFFMDSHPDTNGFTQVGDFTQDQQASHCLVHRLGGNVKVLSTQLAKLVSLEAFQQRHNHAIFDPRPLPMSAPVSPAARPSSQPNFAHQPHVGMFQESWGITQAHASAGLRPGPGHKRQRSRSVPGPVDFAMFQNPMPSFFIQQPNDMPSPDANIYAPTPQQPSALGGHGLRINTQANYGMDSRQFPMSATTAPSPADFANSNYFAGPDSGTPLPVHTPFSTGFLSPMINPSSLAPPQSVSPLSFGSQHGEGSMGEHSPPLSVMGRPQSAADMYSINDSSCAVSDDGSGLNEMYSKHTITLPMHPHSANGFVDACHGGPAGDGVGGGELDMNQLVSFDTVDPSSLSPESMPTHM